MAPKAGKMQSLINWRIKVTLNDSRTLTGQMLAFDKHMNLVIAECEEFRRVKAKKAKGQKVADGEEDDEEEEMKRMLGLVILRGETIVTLSVEGPPPAHDDKSLTGLLPGPGLGAPAGRGMGLQAPTMRMAPVPAGMPGMMGGPPPPGFGAPPGFMPPPPGFGGR
ncbi:Sm-like ribonucleoprotein [Meredithblackwellia eburnea MCA 4105]